MAKETDARIAGFKAASEGLPRYAPAEYPTDWLEGFDGFAQGCAANKATSTELRATHAALPRSCVKIYRTSGTPRSLDGSWGRK